MRFLTELSALDMFIIRAFQWNYISIYQNDMMWYNIVSKPLTVVQYEYGTRPYDTILHVCITNIIHDVRYVKYTL